MQFSTHQVMESSKTAFREQWFLTIPCPPHININASISLKEPHNANNP